MKCKKATVCNIIEMLKKDIAQYSTKQCMENTHFFHFNENILPINILHCTFYSQHFTHIITLKIFHEKTSDHISHLTSHILLKAFYSKHFTKNISLKNISHLTFYLKHFTNSISLKNISLKNISHNAYKQKNIISLNSHLNI